MSGFLKIRIGAVFPAAENGTNVPLAVRESVNVLQTSLNIKQDSIMPVLTFLSRSLSSPALGHWRTASIQKYVGEVL